LPHWLPDACIAAVLLTAFVVAYRVKDDDPEWLERWKALSPADRTRIAAAARSGALLASQEEIELAAGFARRDRRRNGRWTLVNIARLLLGIVLVVAGIVADSIVFIVFGAVFLIAGLWTARYSHNLARAERETIARDHSQ
jgi:Flp pilus assembly protein TadB